MSPHRRFAMGWPEAIGRRDHAKHGGGVFSLPASEGEKERPSVQSAAAADGLENHNPMLSPGFFGRVASRTRLGPDPCHTACRPVAGRLAWPATKRRRERTERGLRAFGRGEPTGLFREPRPGSRGLLGPFQDRPAGDGLPADGAVLRREQRHRGPAVGKPSARSVEPLPKHIPIRSPGKGPALRLSLPTFRRARAGSRSRTPERIPHVHTAPASG